MNKFIETGYLYYEVETWVVRTLNTEMDFSISAFNRNNKLLSFKRNADFIPNKEENGANVSE